MPGPYRYDASYAEIVRLSNGDDALVRCVRPEDRDLLREGFERFSEESRYFRFFTAKDRLTEAELRYLTEVDGTDHFALGAVRARPDGRPEGMGIARFIRMPDRPEVAEPAIAVADDCQNLGLGTLLFQRLVEAAVERGIVWFECHMLGDNRGMKALLDDVSEDMTWRAGDDGVMIATLRIADVPEAPPPDAARRESLVRRLLAAAAEQVISLVPSLRREPETPGKP